MEARYFEFSTGGRDIKGRFPKKYTPCGRRLFQTQTQIKGFSQLAINFKVQHYNQLARKPGSIQVLVF
jgi:hypothetical protein